MAETTSFRPADDTNCGNQHTAHRHGKTHTYRCDRPQGHDGRCKDSTRLGVTWNKEGSGG